MKCDVSEVEWAAAAVKIQKMQAKVAEVGYL